MQRYGSADHNLFAALLDDRAGDGCLCMQNVRADTKQRNDGRQEKSLHSSVTWE
jgi:hypothetical protein